MDVKVGLTQYRRNIDQGAEEVEGGTRLHNEELHNF
jgi:hypothetical protein